jgi:hypothetical protein
MRNTRFLPYLALIAVMTCQYGQSGRAAQDAGALTPADVRQAVHELEDMITSLSVKCTFSGVTHHPEHRDIPIQLRNVETSTVEESGRARCEIDGQSAKIVDGKAVIRPAKRISTFDGSVCRIAAGITRKTGGLIIKSRMGLGWTLDPFEMTTNYYEKPVSQILGERNGKIVGRALHDGHNVLVVETDAITRNDRNWNYRFLIDPTLNFAIVKRSQLIQFPPNQAWIEFDYIDSHLHREVATGVWFPSQVVIKTTDPNEENARTGTTPRLAWEWNVENEDWVLNPETTDSFFVLDFPPGTTVEDNVNARTFQVAGISDEMLEGQAKLAQDWGLTRGWWALFLLNGVVVTFFVAYLLWLFWKSCGQHHARTSSGTPILQDETHFGVGHEPVGDSHGCSNEIRPVVTGEAKEQHQDRSL